MTEKNSGNNKTRIAAAVIYGLLFSCACVFGYLLETYDAIRSFDTIGFFAFMMCFVLSSAFAYAIIYISNGLIIRNVKDRGSGTGHPDDPENADEIMTKEDDGSSGEESGGRFAAMVFLIIFACNLLVLFGVYPGFFVYDAFDELNEVLTRTFTTHHPLLHVVTMGGMIAAAHKAGLSWNNSIFLYLLLQSAFISGVFTYVICFLRKRLAPVFIVIGGMLYYALFPTVVMYTLCSSKDGLFSAFFLLFFIRLIEWTDDPGVLNKKSFIVSYVFFTAGMMLYRHNALYAYLVFAVIMSAILVRRLFMRKENIGREEKDGNDKALFPSSRKKRGAVRTAALLFAPLLLTFIVNDSLRLFLHADDSERQEMLTVPIMQLARTYSFSPEDFSGEEKDTLYAYLPEEALKRYVPKLADGVKIDFDNEAFGRDPGAFFSLWMEQGLKHPMTYLNAWLNTSYGYWYPMAVINVYQGNTVFTFTYTESSYFGYETELPGERKSFFPAIDNLYRSISLERFWQTTPPLSFLLSPACLFWAYLLFAFCLITDDRKDVRKRILPFIPVFLYWLTLLLGPTYLVRYIVIFWTLLPPVLWWVFAHGNRD